ncbi:MAG: CRISPR system precrRNA processing endoribonuclease RAMP protein Cas6, partial [Bacteroidota bacterium]|nr:CRISPR system precrRNA processing endoribonuclease RAMP protein Cas6 [Bacteroidota bacterium]
KENECVCPGQSCSDCNLADQCLYTAIFESRVSGSGPLPFPGLFQLPPPYIFHSESFSSIGKNRAETHRINLRLFGPLTKYLNVLIRAMVKAGENGIGKGKALLHLAEVCDVNTGQILFVHNSGWRLPPPIHRLRFNKGALYSTVKIQLQSPLRLSKLGSDPKKLSAEIFFRHLLRRFQLMVYLYGENFTRIDMGKFKSEISKLSFHAELHYEKLYRYSQRQGCKVPMHGFLGCIEFGGISPFLAELIRVGEHVHLGKATVMGLGNYKIISAVG